MSSAPTVIIIFGAAVWKGSVPSNAMRRRVRGALTSVPQNGEVLFIATGGVGKYPPSEASVMAELLRQAGIPDSRIILDEQATDTLDSVSNCVALLRNLPSFGDVIVCSDVYHIPRCRWLFRMRGIVTLSGRVTSGRPENTIRRWFYYYLREVFAIPWDTLLLTFSAQRS